MLKPSMRPRHAVPLGVAHPAPSRLVPITHTDRAPLRLHSTRYAGGPRTDPEPRSDNPYRVAAQDWHGALEFHGPFAKYLEGGLASARAEQRSDPETWWRSAYLVQRLTQHFPPALVQACARLRALRAAHLAWERLQWDGSEEEALAAEDALSDRIARLVAPHGHSVAWLLRQDARLLTYVWQHYYPASTASTTATTATSRPLHARPPSPTTGQRRAS